MALQVTHPQPGIVRFTLNRAAVRNALNPDLIQALTTAFQHVTLDTRVVMLDGEGEMFCAGADLNWMKNSLHSPTTAIQAEAQQLADLLHTMQCCPCPVIAYTHGGVFGGGLGLLAVCDVVIAHPATRFCFTEAKLGLVPAVIAPWVIRQIGYSALRALTLTAQVFDTDTAQRIGLVHTVDAQHGALLAAAQNISHLGPQATRQAKQWLNELVPLSPSAENAVALITHCRQSDEGQEGMQAFLEKRSPNWCKPTV
jgi:methylglutaconyl-CoA hydratase